MKLDFIPEPLLEFANDQHEEHPKDGLFLYGPVPSAAEKSGLKFGVIGTKAGLELFNQWSDLIRRFIPAHRPVSVVR
jgi:hypothetical protein